MEEQKKMKIEKKEYYITKSTEPLIIERNSTTIDNDKKYHHWLVLEVEGRGEVINEEITEILENNEEDNIWNLEDYFDIVSEEEEELIGYLKKNQINNDGGEDTTWDSRIDNAYGVTYKKYYHDLVYVVEDLSKKQKEDLENMGFDVREN